MRYSNPIRDRAALAAGALTVMVAVTACSGSTGDSGASATLSSPRTTAQAPVPEPGGGEVDPTESGAPPAAASSSSTSSAPSSAVTPPSMSKVTGDVTTVARKYVEVRENAQSYYQKTPRSWLSQMKPLVSATLYAKMKRDASGAQNGNLGNVWATAHARKLTVHVVSKCQVNNQGGPNTASRKFLTCTVNDKPADKDGKVLPLTQIPPNWPYAGAQAAAQLDMRKEKGRWVVNADYTGQAD